MSYLCVNYNIICKTSLKTLKGLHPENQDYLRENRWPPVWYLKDIDYYQRCMNEMNRECKQGTHGKSIDDDDTCLCFSGGKSVKCLYVSVMKYECVTQLLLLTPYALDYPPTHSFIAFYLI